MKALYATKAGIPPRAVAELLANLMAWDGVLE